MRQISMAVIQGHFGIDAKALLSIAEELYFSKMRYVCFELLFTKTHLKKLRK
jgi:hypothetical protein